MSGLLLYLDFEKAFNSLDCEFMVKVLHAFGFGSDICQSVETCYKDIKSAVSVNGRMSSLLSIKKGCRQGDPTSPYLFFLCVEILTIILRQNQNINGIVISETEHKISQCADFTEMVLN